MISTCPSCQKQVSIPPNVESAALVRCPLCEAEYVLSESLALAPPELIPVASAAEWGLSPENGGADRRISEENEAVVVSEGFPAMPASAQLRPRKQKSGLQVSIEVVAGGLAGCLVAYYALAFYFGPHLHRIGLPKLPLPFISWITAPPTERNEEESEPADGDTYGKQSLNRSKTLVPVQRMGTRENPKFHPGTRGVQRERSHAEHGNESKPGKKSGIVAAIKTSYS
ncbi:MAG: zinc-ribbon domain-containing protein [Planctomycetes bacterium]|nr:zinc-ribbon domain-containing protein [Planctomycetota bacterium]